MIDSVRLLTKHRSSGDYMMIKKIFKNKTCRRAVLSVAASVLSAAAVFTFGVSRAGASSTSTSIYTGSVYTHQDMFDGMQIYNGIDVSHWQNTIDWESVKDAETDFAIIKLGQRSNSGSLGLDPNFLTNIQGANNAGIPAGVYFFTEAVNTTEAAQEAQYCVDTIRNNGVKVDMPIAIDFETYSTTNKGRNYNANLSTAQYTAIVSAFCDIISSNGYTPMIYANSSCLQSTLDGNALADSYRIWLAKYNTNSAKGASPYSGKYYMWQYSSKGSVDGISGNVDCNFLYSASGIPVEKSAAASKSAVNTAYSIKKCSSSSVKKQVYNGTEIKPEFTLTNDDTGEDLVEGKDYTVEYRNNVDSGQAVITCTGINGYKGTKTIYFTIKPADIKELTVTQKNKKIVLKLKQATGADGYYLYKKKNSNGKFYLAANIKPENIRKFTDSSVKKYEEYSYKLRPYGNINSKTKVYGSYYKFQAAAISGKKKVKTRYKASITSNPFGKGSSLGSIKARKKADFLGYAVKTNGRRSIHVRYKGKEGYISYTGREKIVK